MTTAPHLLSPPHTTTRSFRPIPRVRPVQPVQPVQPSGLRYEGRRDVPCGLSTEIERAGRLARSRLAGHSVIDPSRRGFTEFWRPQQEMALIDGIVRGTTAYRYNTIIIQVSRPPLLSSGNPFFLLLPGATPAKPEKGFSKNDDLAALDELSLITITCRFSPSATCRESACLIGARGMSDQTALAAVSFSVCVRCLCLSGTSAVPGAGQACLQNKHIRESPTGIPGPKRQKAGLTSSHLTGELSGEMTFCCPYSPRTFCTFRQSD
ncbi:hypothetical protein TESG_08266 [Trichophyton tonsurans CBS 112818]|uniref:Uncharacterized protein n=1 Tax=Trichophyton tonsurans (strain CBS 112818) TaxID=647933 RepID=F2RPA1_TRIT1|nr:hypothetical protein TESG_08266 [Trichophyton tonsurans CBS 112818]